MYTYDYPKADITVDCVLFGFNAEEARLEVVLIRRAADPYKGRWALPGGYIELAQETKMTWDQANPAEVGAARAKYNAMLAAGGDAFFVMASEDAENTRGERIASGPDGLGGSFASVANYGQMILRSKSETSAEAARREMQEETGVEIDYLEQLMTFDAPDRDPRGRVFSVAHYALVRSKDHATKAGSDAREARWMPVEAALTMPINIVAFDHALILKTAVERLQAKIKYQPIGFTLLPEKFTLGQLQKLYEAILFRELDKRNFRKRILAMDILDDELEEFTTTGGRPAQLYAFDKKAYDKAVENGFNFNFEI